MEKKDERSGDLGVYDPSPDMSLIRNTQHQARKEQITKGREGGVTKKREQ